MLQRYNIIFKLARKKRKKFCFSWKVFVFLDKFILYTLLYIYELMNLWINENGHPWHPSGIQTGTRPELAPLAHLAPVRTHGGTHGHPWHPSGIQTGTRPELAPLAPWHPSGLMEAHTGTPGTLQGTGGIFAQTSRGGEGWTAPLWRRVSREFRGVFLGSYLWKSVNYEYFWEPYFRSAHFATC